MKTAENQPILRTAEDFLAWEEAQPERYEFYDGTIRMMVGARGTHNIISINLRNALQARRPKGCQAYSESYKLRINNTIVYPDVLLTCDPDSRRKTVTEHALLTAEVLSPSSVRDDSFRKKALYLAVPTLRYYLILSQEYCQVEVYSRTDDGLVTLQLYDRLDQHIALPGLGITIPMSALYDDTDVSEDLTDFIDRRETDE